MNTNDQAPECCPFCGAKGKDISFDGNFQCHPCGTVCCETVDRFWQTQTCATAERERLTRERGEARAEALVHLRNLLQAQDERDAAIARVKQLESEGAGWPDLQREWFGDKYAAMQPWDAVRARIEDSEARVKRLEEAGDAMAADDQCHPHLMEQWEKAKEATP